MSKKQKRRVSTPASPVARTSAPAASSNSSVVQARVRSQIFEFKPDYSYIKNDLKRISIIAVSFLAALVILSFIVPLIIK